MHASALFGRPAILHGNSFNVGHYAQTFQPFFHTCYAYRRIDFLQFCTTFRDLDFAWVSQGQRKAKPVGFIFSHFSTDQDEILYGVDASLVGHPGAISEWD